MEMPSNQIAASLNMLLISYFICSQCSFSKHILALLTNTLKYNNSYWLRIHFHQTDASA